MANEIEHILLYLLAFLFPLLWGEGWVLSAVNFWGPDTDVEVGL